MSIPKQEKKISHAPLHLASKADTVSHMNLYETLSDKLNGKDRRKWLNNTFLVASGDDIAVVLHKTAVVTVHSDSSMTLDSGGWETNTTKDRINAFLPGGCKLYQENFVWYITTDNHRTRVPFERGMRISQFGEIL